MAFVDLNVIFIFKCNLSAIIDLCPEANNGEDDGWGWTIEDER